MSLDHIRNNAIRSYWAAIQKWATTQELTKEEVHARLKESMGYDHLADLSNKKLMEMAFEISTIADGGPGL